jgi:hypothetical protein
MISMAKITYNWFLHAVFLDEHGLSNLYILLCLDQILPTLNTKGEAASRIHLIRDGVLQPPFFRDVKTFR